MVIGEALKQSRERLMSAGITDCDFDAHQLMLFVLGISPARLAVSKKDEMTDEKIKLLEMYINKRISGYPLQYIIGEWEFFGFPFKVGEGVLIPRADTETLVELAIDFLKEKKNAVAVDLCSGSGCIAISVAKKTEARLYAVELSEKAAVYLEKNTALNNCEKNVTIVKSDIFDKNVFDRIPQADVILSNPPYLSQKDMDELQTEVKSEPEIALFGGKNGYDFYEKMFSEWLEKLNNGGLFAVEIGMNQHERVSEYMCAAGIEPKYKRDYSGIIRVVYGYKNNK